MPGGGGGGRVSMHDQLLALYGASEKLHEAFRLFVDAGDIETADRLRLSSEEVTRAIGQLVISRSARRIGGQR